MLYQSRTQQRRSRKGMSLLFLPFESHPTSCLSSYPLTPLMFLSKLNCVSLLQIVTIHWKIRFAMLFLLLSKLSLFFLVFRALIGQLTRILWRTQRHSDNQGTDGKMREKGWEFFLSYYIYRNMHKGNTLLTDENSLGWCIYQKSDNFNNN